MKIAFIHDSFQKLGVQYISSILKKNGHETRLFVDPQLFNDTYFSIPRLGQVFDYKTIIKEELETYHPDLIAFSVVTDFYQRACRLAEYFKKTMAVPVLFGGNHPTLVPERVIGKEFVDMVCIGEGEYPLLELADSMRKKQVDYTIKNLWFKKDGKIIKNGLRPLIADLDKLPFPDQEIYRETSPHFKTAYFCAASRGCPNACTYCINSYLHSCYKDEKKFYYRRTVKNLIEELWKAKQKYGIKHVMFVDESFGHGKEWLEEFSLEYRNKINLPFHCTMYPGDVTEKKVRLIKKAGCVEINVGIQSWDENLMKRIGRAISAETVREAITLIKKSRIRLVTEEIIGLPGQDEGSLFKAADIYNRVKPARSFLHPLKYYPNTVLTNRALADGIVDEADREKILEGSYGKSFQQGGDCLDENKYRIIFLFFIARIFPRFLFKFIMRRKLYEVLPVRFILTINGVLDNLFSYSVDTHILRMRFFISYLFFLNKFCRRALRRKR